MSSMSGLSLPFVGPSLTFRQHVVKQSIPTRDPKVDCDTPIPSLQFRKNNVSILCGAARYGGEKAVSKAMSPMTVQLELPAFDCLFEKACNPEYESVRDECNVWMLSLFDPPLQMNDSNYGLYLKGLYPLFLAVLFPSCPSRKRLALITKLIIWFFILDDIREKADSRKQLQLLQGLKSIFKSDLGQKYPLSKQKKTDSSSFLPNKSSSERNRCLSTFVDRFKEDVWEEICADMSTSIRKKFVAEMTSYVDSVHQHEELRQKRRLGVEESKDFTFNDLMELRLDDSFAKTWSNSIMEYALGIDLEDILGDTQKGVEFLREKVEKLKYVSSCHVTWTNDILSLRKEFLEDDCLSIINVLTKQRGISFPIVDQRGATIVQEVIEEVWKMIQENEKIAACLLEEVKRSQGLEPYEHNQIIMYCEELCKGMAGNMYWSTLTARYNGISPLPWQTRTSFSIPDHTNFPTVDFLNF